MKRQFHSRIKLDRYQNIVVAKFIMLPSFNVFRVRAAFPHLWESLKSNWNDGIFYDKFRFRESSELCSIWERQKICCGGYLIEDAGKKEAGGTRAKRFKDTSE